MTTLPALNVQPVSDKAPGLLNRITAANKLLMTANDGRSIVQVDPTSVIGSGVTPAPDYVSISNVTLSGSQTVDGSTPANGKVVLCVGQTNAVENGPQVVNTSGAWTRPSYYNSDAAVAAVLGLGTGLVLNGATYAGSQWYLKSGSTLAGAKVYRRVIPGVTLYMPPPNGTNDLPAFTALVSELTGVGGKIQFQSGLYKSPTGFQLTSVAGIHVAGVSSSVSGTPSTLFQYTGARASRSAIFRIDTCDSCSIEDVGFLSTASGPEYGCLIGGTSHDANYCHVYDCFAYGGAAAAPVATSATSINASTCVNTTVAITLSAATVPYLIGTQLLLCSRAGGGVALKGLITASSGTAVSFIPTDVFGTGTHTDWDVLQPMNAFNIGSSELCAIYRSQATACYNNFHVEGVGGLVEATCSTSIPLGPSFRTGNTASNIKLFGNSDPNGAYGMSVALLVDGAVNFEASIGMGDNFLGSGPAYILKGILGGTIHGINGQGPSGSSVMSVEACGGLHIRGVYGDCVSGFFVLNKGSNVNCSIDALCVGNGNITMNTFSGGFAGFSSWYDVQTARLNHDFLNAQHIESKFGVIYTSSGLSLGTGRNDNVSLTTAFELISGPVGAFSISGFGASNDGQVVRFFYLGTQVVTLLHQNSNSISGNRLICPSGADTVLTPRSGGCLSFDAIYSASAGAWILILPAPLEQVGSVTLGAGVSAAISATITSGSVITVSLKTPTGHSLTVDYAALASDRAVGAPGSFKITALLAAGTINTADTSTLDWRVVNP